MQINKAKIRRNADSFIEELWIFEGDQKGRIECNLISEGPQRIQIMKLPGYTCTHFCKVNSSPRGPQ